MVDTVLFAGDLNGDGRTDSLVIEAKPGQHDGLRPYRAALRLGGRATVAWSSGWDDEFGREIELLKRVRVSRTSVLLVLDSPQADYDGIWILRVAGDSVVKVGEHGIDYGAGDIALDAAASGIVLRAAPVEHLALRGLRSLPHTKCAAHQMSGVEAHFDVVRGMFVAPRGICVAASGESGAEGSS